MTVWFCDRCGAQVNRDSVSAGKYEIQMSCVDHSNDTWAAPRFYKRNLKFCDQCAMEMEQFLDDEFSKIPPVLKAEVKRGE